MAKPDEILEMSDEDFLNQGASAIKVDPTPDNKDPKPTVTDTDDDDADDGDNANIDDKSDDDKQDDKSDSDDDDKKDSTDSDKAPGDDKADKAKDDIDKLADKPTEGPTEAEYAAIGKQLMSEFKANGTTMKMKSVDDAIQLMQMGANYHKKMAGLKPSLKTLKLLENNGLLDPEKLNYIIDLAQKKPEAITQLLKDSKIDPMTIDLAGTEPYVSTTRTVSDTDILLDEVLDSISSSPAYSKTLTVLGEEWDAESRSAIAKNPTVIQAINTHMENGIYDQVAAAIAYERSLGKLVGLGDYEAYQKVGAYMHENNLFVHGANATPTNGAQNQTKPSAPNKADSDEQERLRLERKNAASPSRQQKTPVQDTNNYNPLEMSDEDFIKLNKLRI
jgi:hypothetical protein